MLVPGNHDAPLVRAWVASAGPQRSGRASDVPLDASATLAQRLGLARPRRASSVAVPRGVAVRPRVGDPRPLPRPPPVACVRLRDRARAAQPAAARTATSDRLRARGGRRSRGFAGTAAAPARGAARRSSPSCCAPRRCRACAASCFIRRFAPLTAALLGLQVRRASIPALAARRRSGSGSTPTGSCSATCTGSGRWPTTTRRRGAAPDGRPRLANTGSWVHEPLLVHRASPPHPYWPGGAVLLEDGGDPQAISLLDDAQCRGATAVAGGCRRTRATGSRARARRRTSARSSRSPATASSSCRCDASGSCQPVIRPSTSAASGPGVTTRLVQPEPAAPPVVSSARTTVVPIAITRPPARARQARRGGRVGDLEVLGERGLVALGRRDPAVERDRRDRDPARDQRA